MISAETLAIAETVFYIGAACIVGIPVFVGLAKIFFNK